MKTLPLKISIRDKYGPAMSMQTQEEADAYFELLTNHNLAHQALEGKPLSQEYAEKVEKMNLGYFAGYYDSETRERVERLFKCSHPVFGSIEDNGPPAAKDALKAGADLVRSNS